MLLKVFAHIDMDAFFAAVEQRDNPRLCGKPVVVGADPQNGRGRGVVSTCSYEARKFGVHSAMPISTAYRLCPHAVFLPVDMKKYSQASDEIFKILYDFTPDIEPISVDEAFLDITGSYHFYGTPLNTCREIKKRIMDRSHLTASIGLAPVKMAAKIASDLSKPDGLLEVKGENLKEFLGPLDIAKLWGVGPKTKKALNILGIKTIDDLARTSLKDLRRQFGEHGQHLHDLAQGIDPREIVTDSEMKSVSHEHTFDTDTGSPDEVREVLAILSEKVSRRLRRYSLKGKTLTLKVRLKGFETSTKAFTFGERTNFSDTIYKKAHELFREFHKPGMKFRLVGVRMSHFDDAYVRESLFEDEMTKKNEKVHAAVDRIKDKFGETAIVRGLSLRNEKYRHQSGGVEYQRSA